MPLTNMQVKELQQKQSSYGCGYYYCLSCYPIQYACEFCNTQFTNPIANGEVYECTECYLVNNEEE